MHACIHKCKLHIASNLCLVVPDVAFIVVSNKAFLGYKQVRGEPVYAYIVTTATLTKATLQC